MGYPFFNPPTVQKVNKIEEGNFFVPTEGVLPESVTEELSPVKAKRQKLFKTVAWVVGGVVFVLMGYFTIADYYNILLG